MSCVSKKLAFLLMLVFSMSVLTSCWDRRELDTLIIVTGFCIDKGEESKLKITLQAGEVIESSGGGKGGGQETKNSSFYMLSKQAGSLHSGISEIDRESTGELFLSHNQIIIFSEAIAEEGLEQYMDYFLRGRENRLEENLLISEGSAEDILKNEVQKGEIPSATLSNMITSITKHSTIYNVNLLNYVSDLLDETKSPVIPLISTQEKNNKTRYVFSGMGIIKDGKLVGKLDSNQTIGYQWVMGGMNGGDMEIITAEGSVAVKVTKGESKTNVVIKSGDRAEVYLDISTELNIGEITGYKEAKLEDIIKVLKKEVPVKITGYIQDCFDRAASLDADIFGFGQSVHQNNKTKWDSIKDKWDEIFPKTKLYLSINVKVTETGETGETLDMIKP